MGGSPDPTTGTIEGLKATPGDLTVKQVGRSGDRPTTDDPSTTETHGVYGKVVFRNPADGDFRLVADSAGIDSALHIKEVARDASQSGRPVGKAPDAGAFECTEVPHAGRSWWVASAGDDAGSRSRPFPAPRAMPALTTVFTCRPARTATNP